MDPADFEFIDPNRLPDGLVDKAKYLYNLFYDEDVSINEELMKILKSGEKIPEKLQMLYNKIPEGTKEKILEQTKKAGNTIYEHLPEKEDWEQTGSEVGQVLKYLAVKGLWLLNTTMQYSGKGLFKVIGKMQDHINDMYDVYAKPPENIESPSPTIPTSSPSSSPTPSPTASAKLSSTPKSIPRTYTSTPTPAPSSTPSPSPTPFDRLVQTAELTKQNEDFRTFEPTPIVMSPTPFTPTPRIDRDFAFINQPPGAPSIHSPTALPSLHSPTPSSVHTPAPATKAPTPTPRRTRYRDLDDPPEMPKIDLNIDAPIGNHEDKFPKPSPTPAQTKFRHFDDPPESEFEMPQWIKKVWANIWKNDPEAPHFDDNPKEYEEKNKKYHEPVRTNLVRKKVANTGIVIRKKQMPEEMKQVYYRRKKRIGLM
jgi:hypothetical protein